MRNNQPQHTSQHRQVIAYGIKSGTQYAVYLITACQEAVNSVSEKADNQQPFEDVELMGKDQINQKRKNNRPVKGNEVDP